MANSTKENKHYKFNLVKYVYGQLYKGYLASGKAKLYKVHHIKAQTWYYALKKLVEEGKVKDAQLGETEDTACSVVVEGFNDNEKDMWYKPYLKAIKENYEKEVA